MADEKEIPVCADCRSDSIYADAYAQWDTKKQIWDIANAFERTIFCNNCNRETDIEWVKLNEYLREQLTNPKEKTNG